MSRWRASWRERLRIFLTGDIWLSVLTFNEQRFQPVMLDVKCPLSMPESDDQAPPFGSFGAFAEMNTKDKGLII